MGIKSGYLFLFLLLGFSFTAYGDEPVKHPGLKTVVIDPGHGGKDSGAPGKSPSSHEKHIVLAVSKALGARIQKAYPDVKVVYTRSTDVFVELNERAKIAKRNHADLFISIHCNSNQSSRPYGASVHILGPKSKNRKNQKDYFAASMSVARRENSVMLLEDDYQTTYKGFDPDSPESVISHNLMWNANYGNSLLFAAEVDAVLKKAPFRESDYTGIHQDIFYLLWATNMPAALLELGFMSNPADYKILSSRQGQEDIAQLLFEAFCVYKKQYDESVKVESLPSEAVEAPQPEAVVPDEYYGIQIMGLARRLDSADKAFKGLAPSALKGPQDKVYKYVCGRYATREEAADALTGVRKVFPQAFIVLVKGETVTRK